MNQVSYEGIWKKVKSNFLPFLQHFLDLQCVIILSCQHKNNQLSLAVNTIAAHSNQSESSNAPQQLITTVIWSPV